MTQLTEQQRAWLDVRNGYDLIHVHHEFEQVFNLDEKTASFLILQWIDN